MSTTADKEDIRAEIAQQEKAFLMEHYASHLLDALGSGDDLEDDEVEALLTARSYVSPPLAKRINDLLSGRTDEAADAAAAVPADVCARCPS